MSECSCLGERSSEHDEGLSNVSLDSLLLDSNHVEPHGLGEGSALADSDDITDSGSLEGRGEMGGEIVMSLFESVVLFDVVEVISSDGDGPVHLVRENDTLEDSASDGHGRGEGALLVNVLALNGGLGSLEPEADFLVVPLSSEGFLSNQLLGVLEDSELFLIGLFGLDVSHLYFSK